MPNVLGNYGKNHIILEGADGCGKSSLIDVMKIRLINHGYNVVTCRNPASPELYERMHAGNMSAYDIAMNTLSDMLEQYHAEVAPVKREKNIVILQDRSALISAQIYNVPKMSMAEYDIWSHVAYHLYEKYYRPSAQFVILTNHRHRAEINVFTDNKTQDDYRRLAQSGGLLWQAFIPFSSEGNIDECAYKLLRECGYDT